MAVSWSDFLNGQTGSVIRVAINAFNNSVVTDVNKNTSDTASNTSTISSNTSAITALGINDVAQDGRLDILESPDTVILNDVTGSEPAPAVGQVHYANGVWNMQGDYLDVLLQVGREMHTEVVNNTGVTILNGKAVTNNGVSGGTPQVKLAIADSFANAIIFGVATHDIPHGSKGIVTTNGVIHDLNTSTTTLGVPLYLSDVDAGDWVEVAPDIVSQIGGATIQDASVGELFVKIRNNIVLPNVIGLLQKQATGGVYDLTAIPQNIENYATDGNVGVVIDLLNGTITVPIDGFYNGSFSTTLSFVSAASTRTIYAEIYNLTTASIVSTYVYNVPRDASEASFSFTTKFIGSAGNIYVMRLRSAPDMSVTLTDVSMDLASIRL
jgi:hypothetical protein